MSMEGSRAGEGRPALGEGCRLWPGSSVLETEAGERCSFGNGSDVLRCRLEDRVCINRRNFVNDSSIGRMTYTGVGTSIHGADVGRFCSIAGGVVIGGADHDWGAVSTYTPARMRFAREGGYADELGRDFRCRVGSDVWIGAHATVLGKASVGHGAVVGAGAVVTSDVPPYAIAVGVPARVVKFRFGPSVIDALLGIAWWEWPLEAVLENERLITARPTDAVLGEMARIGKIVGRA